MNVSSTEFFRTGSDSRAASAAATGVEAVVGDDGEFEETVEDRLLTAHRLAILWIQMITTANAMAIVCVESKRFEDAMNILKQAEHWAQRDDVLSSVQRRNARAHIQDAFASYFFRRGRAQAALHYTKRALELHENLGNFDCIAVDLLHISAIQCQLGLFKDSHKVTDNVTLFPVSLWLSVISQFMPR
jgi:tetratricopeptide (TPR) repeat protein